MKHHYFELISPSSSTLFLERISLRLSQMSTLCDKWISLWFFQILTLFVECISSWFFQVLTLFVEGFHFESFRSWIICRMDYTLILLHLNFICRGDVTSILSELDYIEWIYPANHLDLDFLSNNGFFLINILKRKFICRRLELFITSSILWTDVQVKAPSRERIHMTFLNTLLIYVITSTHHDMGFLSIFRDWVWLDKLDEYGYIWPVEWDEYFMIVILFSRSH